MKPAEQIALWADMLRDISALGLQYAQNVYDHERYQTLQNLMIEMLAYATAHEHEDLEPLRTTVFSRPSPVVGGAAAIISSEGRLLLMRRSDNHLWVMPGGMAEVGETPAQVVVREAYEETGIRCEVVRLVGIYDSRYWDPGRAQHLYKLTFLCRPLKAEAPEEPTHAQETLDIAWFSETALPEDLYEGHRKRIDDAFAVWRGSQDVYSDH